MKPWIARDFTFAPRLLALLVGASVSLRAAEQDLALAQSLKSAGWPNPLRADRQRPIDARLLKLETVGVAGSGLFRGKVHVVRSAKEVQALSGRLNPGDQLVLAGTGWKDARFIFAGRGQPEAPILVRPEQPGEVVFSGTAGVTFHGSHLVITGLEFRGVTVPATGSVVFRLGNGREAPAERCVVNRISIEECNSPVTNDWPRLKAWYLTADYGRDNTVANSTFAGLRHIGQMVGAAQLPEDGSLQRLHLLTNRFLNRPALDDQNGYEIIQLGWSQMKARPSGSLIQGNTFEHCDGENEIITVKAADVFVRGNTFAGCQGALVLRETDRVLVQDNLFDGRGRTNTSGVRLCGADHVIVGNTFRRLQQPANYYYWAISMMAASGENSGDAPAGYGRSKRVLIAGNRFERNDTRLAIGIYPRPQYPLLPQAIHVRDNVFIGGPAKSAFDFVAPDSTGALARELHESGNQFLP